ncbi:hypothetical protein RGF97_26275 [Streptomyces roseicoloratus]|uniref:Uncharacterized protein n=1 Tax=Streptomyces roseicoloratus TaxID=2508722 RepID=A0ABY9S1A2_9ACTN|nr:hypothetical protein [Streptomyces roseicoloratus]WMX47611.1 hypothetical protein RGF97_26275 [Streptomyces roseicoloratus]
MFDRVGEAEQRPRRRFSVTYEDGSAAVVAGELERRPAGTGVREGRAPPAGRPVLAGGEDRAPRCRQRHLAGRGPGAGGAVAGCGRGGAVPPGEHPASVTPARRPARMLGTTPARAYLRVRPGRQPACAPGRTPECAPVRVPGAVAYQT